MGLVCILAICAAGPLTLNGDLAADRAAGCETERDLAVADGAYVCRGGASLRIPAPRFFEPTHGQLSFTVTPDWRGDDNQRHTFLHLGLGPHHFTIFKAETNGVRLVCKASEKTTTAIELGVRDWRPGEDHQIRAAWRQLGHVMYLELQVDDERQWVGDAVPVPVVDPWLWLGARGAPDREPALALIRDVTLTPEPPELPFSLDPKPPVNATVDLSKATPFRAVHAGVTPWNSAGFPLPFAIGSELYQRFAQCRWKQVRLVGVSEQWLFGAGLSRGDDGQLKINWKPFDDMLDIVEAAGARPYVRLAFHVPRLLSTAPEGGNAAALYQMPADVNEFVDLMGAIAEHTAKRFPGAWYVASLNEPDLWVPQGGDWQAVLKLYGLVSQRVKQVDPTAKVGGPGIAFDPRQNGGQYIVDFLTYAKANRLPVDFVCYHGYKKPHPSEFEAMQQRVDELIDAHWTGPRPRCVLDEWNLWRTDGRQDDEYGAAYLAGALQYQRRAGVAQSFIVSFNPVEPVTEVERSLRRQPGLLPRGGTSPVRVESGPYTADGITRPGLLTHPGSVGRTYVEYDLTLPARQPILHFDSAIVIDRLFQGMDGCTWFVRIKDGDTWHEVFRVTDAQRRWSPREADLSAWAGRRVTLRLEVDHGPMTGTADWAAWGRPRIESAGATLDLLADLDKVTCGQAVVPEPVVYDDDYIRSTTGLPLIKGTVITSPFYVWAMHARLGPDELAVKLDGRDGITADGDAGLTATRDGDRIAMLAWSFDPWTTNPRRFTVKLDSLRFPRRIRISQIDGVHSNPYHTYVRSRAEPGPVDNLTAAEPEVVREELVAGPSVTFELPALAVALVELLPE